MPAKVMVHPEKRKEKDKTDREAILKRRARKRLYAHIASLLSSVENDITVMIMDPDAVVVKDLTTTTQYIKYRFDPGLLMRWDEKYPEFAEILNRKAYISYNGYLCLFCTDCFDLLNDGTLLFKEEFVKAHFRDYCVTALYNENYDILDPESIPYNIPGSIVAKTRKLTKFSPAEKENSKELNFPTSFSTRKSLYYQIKPGKKEEKKQVLKSDVKYCLFPS